MSVKVLRCVVLANNDVFSVYPETAPASIWKLIWLGMLTLTVPVYWLIQVRLVLSMRRQSDGLGVHLR